MEKIGIVETLVDGVVYNCYRYDPDTKQYAIKYRSDGPEILIGGEHICLINTVSYSSKMSWHLINYYGINTELDYIFKGNKICLKSLIYSKLMDNLVYMCPKIEQPKVDLKIILDRKKKVIYSYRKCDDKLVFINNCNTDIIKVVIYKKGKYFVNHVETLLHGFATFIIDYENHYANLYHNGKLFYMCRTDIVASYSSNELHVVKLFLTDFISKTYDSHEILTKYNNCVQFNSNTRGSNLTDVSCHIKKLKWDLKDIGMLAEATQYQEPKIEYKVSVCICVNCKETPSVIMIDKCGHLAYCEKCSEDKKLEKFCAVCSKHYPDSSFIRVNFP